MNAIPVGALILALATPAVASTPSASALPFVQDDFAGALAQAKRRNLPLFVEVWAPW